MKIAVLVLNYILLVFVIFGFIGVVMEPPVDTDAIIGLGIILPVIVLNLVYAHTRKD
jgi:hypothetical protein